MDDKIYRIIVGIDISTTCTGVSIVSYDGENTKVLYIDRIKFKSSRKIKGTELLFYKSKQFKEIFIEKIKGIQVTDIIIEEPLPNSQNLETVNSLLKFNGMISQSIYEATGIVPKYISSYDARKYAFPELMSIRKYNKKGEEYDIEKIRKAIKNNELVLFGSYSWDCSKKFILWSKIAEMYPDIKWVYNKKQELKTENFDASDSLICVLGQISKEKYENTKPMILESNETKININNNIINKVQYKVLFCDKTFDKVIEFS